MNVINIISCGVGSLSQILLKSINNLFYSNFIIYDSLINLNLLNFSNILSIKLLVGKRFNQYSILKKTIYNLIKISYNKYLILCKLKSGDINFFSRINNEINYYNSNFINYIIIPGITTFISSFCKLNWFLSKRYNISNILFITYFNNNNFIKINKNFLNKIVIYYMINNNYYYIFNSIEKKFYRKKYFCFIESCNYIFEHIFIFNIYDYLFYINENFLKFNLPKILIIGDIYSYINIYKLYINII
ncbi:Uroporphyrinogen-III methyltransferase [Candidatus Nasuia deltocephalinicola]|nr:Uroporphyrinogen-III methyltransferase [Candidatus Nasuia deltocephalinicola]